MQNNSNHQHQLSVNSIQSMIEPTTPPSLGRMNSVRFHQKTQSLDLSNFNQFMNSTSSNTHGQFNNNSPLLYVNGSSSAFNNDNNYSNQTSNQYYGFYPNKCSANNSASSTTQSTPVSFNKGNGLPLINEFDILNNNNYMPFSMQVPTEMSNPNPILSKNSINMMTSESPVPVVNVSSVSTKSSTPNSFNDNVFSSTQQETNLSSSSLIKKVPSTTRPVSLSRKIGNSDKSSIAMNEINMKLLDELDYLALSTDQYGCRFLQKKLEDKNIEDSEKVKELLFSQTKEHFLELILDPFGNYLIQKLCDYLTSEQKTIMIKSIYPNIYQISNNQYGTRSLQKIIDVIEEPSQIDLIVEGFTNRSYISTEQVVKLINDLNGNHVIQKCIFKFPATKLNFIIDAIITNNNIVTTSTHKHGCCVLQKLLSVCTLQQTLKISMKIIDYLPNLINDQFGNYIVQFLLDTDELKFYFLPETYKKMSSNLPQLSCMKFSSNVIEKVIKILYTIITKASKISNVIPNQDELVPIVMEIILSMINIFTTNLNILIRDNYGNYTLQTLLDIKNYSTLLTDGKTATAHSTTQLNSNDNSFEKFRQDLTVKITNLIYLTKELLPSIKTTSYAKKIKSKVKDFADFKGVQVADLTPGDDELCNNIQQSLKLNRYKHTRHSSLPNNCFKKPANSSQTNSYETQKNYASTRNYHNNQNQTYSQNQLYETSDPERHYDVSMISKPLSKLDLNLFPPTNESIYNSSNGIEFPKHQLSNLYGKIQNNGYVDPFFNSQPNGIFEENFNTPSPAFNEQRFSSQQYPFHKLSNR